MKSQALAQALKLVSEPRPVPGWCSREKAELLVELIYDNDIDLAVELGVFGGSSFFPMVWAMHYRGQGMVDGIDPWDAAAALEDMHRPENKHWWNNPGMLEKVYQGVEQYRAANGLTNFCRLTRRRAEEVAHIYADGTIGLLHIDGNHGDEPSYRDATLWLPKVKPGGFIVFDDVQWNEGGPLASTLRATQYLSEHATHIKAVDKDNCYVFQTG